MASNRELRKLAEMADEVSDAESSEWEIDWPEGKDAAKRRPVAVAEKDDEEEELERFVLGDKAGFRTNLFLQDTIDTAGHALQDLSLAVVDDGGDTGLAEVDDMHMFFSDEALQPSTAALVVAKPDGTRTRTDAAAWEDSDDERLTVSLARVSRLRKLRRTQDEDLVSGAEYAGRLRQQFLRLNPLPAWAVAAQKALVQREQPAKKRRKTNDDGSSSSSDSDSDGDIEGALPLDTFLRSAGALAGTSALQQQKKKRRLRPEVLDVQKTRDISTDHAGPVTSLAFHPQHAVLLSASESSMVHLHQIAPAAYPTPNPLLTAVRVRQTPLYGGAAFAVSADGREEVVLAGRRRFFHTWDLASGRVQRVSQVLGHAGEHRSMERLRPSPDGAHVAIVATDRKGGGVVNVLDLGTKQWVAQARLDSRSGLADFCWWRDGAGITLLGKDGRVGEWDLETRRFVGVWRDDGSTGGAVLALGGRGGPSVLGGDRWVAVGSSSGIVNLYDRSKLVEAGMVVATPTPARVFEQLTTKVTAVVFTPDGQLLAFASRYKTDALRLAHLPTCTVYRNWPTEKTPLGRITAVAFSRDSDLLAVGNDRGKTRLWEIRS